jgi:glycine cleavage system H protein
MSEVTKEGASSMYPEELKYSKEHEWVKVNDDSAVVGITDYAQDQLGDVVYVELPEIGSQVIQFEVCGTIESVKTVSDLYSPVSGDVIQINKALDDTPELINNEPYGTGWILEIKMKDPSELEQLLSSSAYEEFIQQLS